MDAMRAVYNGSKHLEIEGVAFIDGVTKVEFVINEEDERWRRICIDGDILVLQDGTIVKLEVCKKIGYGEQFALSIVA